MAPLHNSLKKLIQLLKRLRQKSKFFEVNQKFKFYNFIDDKILKDSYDSIEDWSPEVDFELCHKIRIK